jgi:hypothetical protein
MDCSRGFAVEANLAVTECVLLQRVQSHLKRHLAVDIRIVLPAVTIGY